MTDTIETRVARGVALLDKTLADWDERIDVDRLNMANTCDCILGQEFAGARSGDPYDVGVYALFNGDEDRAHAHGFTVIDLDEDFAPLTAEWKRVILARRGGAS